MKGEYLKYWMGTEGLPLIEQWENTGKLTYKDDEEFKLKANKIISIIKLLSKSKQGSTTLNE